jgi:hypothetical protein
MLESIEHRQKDLPLKEINSVAVIGIGGVGSWVATFLALSGVKNLLLVDPDIVEFTNLNRTPFNIASAITKESKVSAITNYILERRECNVIPIEKKFENAGLSMFLDYEIIVDCRDVSTPLPEELQNKMKITGGYNGMDMSIHVNPSGDSIFGEGNNGYTVTPSWLIPPVMIASIITTYLFATWEEENEIIQNINIADLISDVINSKYMN